MANNPSSDPTVMRRLQKAYAKNNMGKGRGIGTAIQSRIVAEAAGQKQARDLQFLRLAQNKQSSELGHNYRMAGVAQGDRRLKDQKDDFGKMIVGGLVGTGMSHIEGERRRKLLAQDRGLAATDRATAINDRRRYYDQQNATGTYMRGGR